MSNITNDTLELIKKAQNYSSEQIAKSIVSSNDLAAYDLQAPAKNLYPVQTPIRNTLPRTTGIGTATNWRTVRNIVGSGFDAMGWVPEGQRSARMSYLTQSLSASYKTLGEEDQASYEAINAGRGFEDIRARMTMRLLQKLMLKEESAIIGGNSSVPLSAPAAPTLSAAALTGATVTAGNYFVYCVALTYEGYRNSSVATGVPTVKTITGSDGISYNLNGGSSNKSAASAMQAITLGQSLSMSVPVVNGAIGYAWFVHTAGAGTTADANNAFLTAITTINSYLLTTPAPMSGALNGGHAGQITTNCSTNSLAFDGLLYFGFNPNAVNGNVNPATGQFQSTSNAGGGYVKSLSTGTPGTGSFLTSSGRGSVDEIDDMLITMWNNNQLSPTVIYCNAQEVRNISKKVLNGGGASPLVRYNVGESASSMQLAASPFVDTYFNPITKQPLRIEVHPNIPPGTILAWADDLPAQYQSNEVPNVAEIRARQDYYQIDWPVTSRQQAVGVYCEEVLVCYAPFAIGIITNIGNG